MTTINDTVKQALRIKHNKLDDEIARLVETAQDEMIRAGVDESVGTEGGSLVKQAVVTFCQMNMTEEKDLIDRYADAFRLQVDDIRKSKKLGPTPQEETEEDDVQ